MAGGYIYFFEKPKDVLYKSHVWVKNSDFEEIDEQISGVKNAFLVSNKYDSIMIACDK